MTALALASRVGEDFSVLDGGVAGCLVLSPDQQDDVGCAGDNNLLGRGGVLGCSTGGLEVADGDGDLFGGGHVVRVDWPGTRLVGLQCEYGLRPSLTVEDVLFPGYRHASRGVSCRSSDNHDSKAAAA